MFITSMFYTICNTLVIVIFDLLGIVTWVSDAFHIDTFA